MFDWDDQELADIIWGEGSEADGQNVPYPEDTQIKYLANYRDNVKRKLTDGEDASTSKSEKNSSVSASRLAMDTQHDVPSFATLKKDRDLRAKKTWLDIGLEISQNQDDKDLGELVGNSWANIGGFDDLDRIFSTDNLDGQSSLGSRDDLWSSSNDLISGPSKSLSQALGSTSWEFDAFGNTAAHFDINSEYMVDEDHSVIPGFRKQDTISSYSRRNFGEFSQQQMRKKVLVNKKGNWSSNQSNPFQRTKLVGEMYDSCPSPIALVPQFYIPPTVQTHQHFSNPYISNYAYGDFTQSMISNSEKPVKMTPREKIEKLRRRQQMRAMHAIQLQQQKLGSQVPNVEYSLSPKSSQEDQFLNMDKPDLEANDGISKIPCYGPDSSNKKNDPSTISEVDDCSAEDTIVYQLQDIVAKLDLKVRMCIRDSLYRLAENATQRCCTSDTSSTMRRSHERMAHLEPNTNHIDRVLAHLLFHRPFKSSSKNADNTPESSTSTKVQTNHCPNNIAMSFLTKGPND